MKFLHISDTHLGYTQYGLLERRQDFLDVFHEAVDTAIDEKVDFILHSGDFFHTSRPSNQTFLEGIEILNRLRDAHIPIFTISGNHDRGSQVRDVSPLAIMEPLGLKLVDSGFTEHNGLFIGGLKYISRAGLRQTKGIRVLLEKFLESINGRNGVKLFMLHQEFSPLFPDSSLYMEEEIPEGFDYIGIGHYHIRQEPKVIKGSTVVYPGSTEFTAYNEKEDEVEKGFYIVSVEDGKFHCKFGTFKRKRPFLSITLNENTLDEDLKDLSSKVLKIIEEGCKKPVVIFKGILKEIEIKDIYSKLSKYGLNDSNVLHFRFNITKESKDISDVSIAGLEEDNIFKALRELISDDELYTTVEETVKNLQTFESIEEVKKYIKENPQILDI